MSSLISLNQTGRTCENTYELIESSIPARRATSRWEKEGECFAPCIESSLTSARFASAAPRPYLWAELHNRKSHKNLTWPGSAHFLYHFMIWDQSWEALKLHENDIKVFPKVFLEIIQPNKENMWKYIRTRRTFYSCPEGHQSLGKRRRVLRTMYRELLDLSKIRFCCSKALLVSRAPQQKISQKPYMTWFCAFSLSFMIWDQSWEALKLHENNKKSVFKGLSWNHWTKQREHVKIHTNS